MDTITINSIAREAEAAAITAAQAMYDRIGGDRYACGFAWVTVYPEHKGNTKAGKSERAILKELGFSLDWTGKSWQLWNPSKSSVQNIDIKEAGAVAYADVLKAHGFKAYAGSRLD
jgi:hypothetical protein